MSSLTSMIHLGDHSEKQDATLQLRLKHRVIIPFHLRLFTENENETPLPRHDWTLLFISGIIVHEFMISLQC